MAKKSTFNNLERYDSCAQLTSAIITNYYSDSFSAGIKLFAKDIRQDIYNIYGLLRIADEIVDGYQGKDSKLLLRRLEKDVYTSLERGFSVNSVVHAFCLTARKYAIGKSLIKPFFESMYMDIVRKTHTFASYTRYIHGSAEVVGLMCLKVFVGGDEKKYKELKHGALSLGAAFQKVNFLRDIREDYEERGRYYFPYGSYEKLDEVTKTIIVRTIEADFNHSKAYIEKLPKQARFGVYLAYKYYSRLLRKLQTTSVIKIKTSRVRLDLLEKTILFTKELLKAYVT